MICIAEDVEGFFWEGIRSSCIIINARKRDTYSVVCIGVCSLPLKVGVI